MDQTEQKKEKTLTAIVVFVLLVTICILAGIILFYITKEIGFEREQREQQIFDNGTTYGIQYTIEQLVVLAEQCEPIPIILENKTINLIAIECLGN